MKFNLLYHLLSLINFIVKFIIIYIKLGSVDNSSIQDSFSAKKGVLRYWLIRIKTRNNAVPLVILQQLHKLDVHHRHELHRFQDAHP